MLNVVISILFGVIEGITEWLPVSSTGHMIIFDALTGFEVSPDFYKIYEVVIQLGAVMAAFIIFFDKIWPFDKKVENPLGKGILSIISKEKFELWIKIFISCVPAAIIGIAFDDKIDELFYNPTSVAIALIAVGILFIVTEIFMKNKKSVINSISEISYRTAFIIGIFQVLAAIFPGTSRSGATIIGALLIGVSRSVAAEYTFYLAIPVMAGASLLKLLKYGIFYSLYEYMLLFIGCLCAFVVSLLIINFLMDYVRKHDFKLFGYYRIGLGILVLILFGFII